MLADELIVDPHPGFVVDGAEMQVHAPAVRARESELALVPDVWVVSRQLEPTEWGLGRKGNTNGQIPCRDVSGVSPSAVVVEGKSPFTVQIQPRGALELPMGVFGMI